MFLLHSTVNRNPKICKICTTHKQTNPLESNRRSDQKNRTQEQKRARAEHPPRGFENPSADRGRLREVHDDGTGRAMVGRGGAPMRRPESRKQLIVLSSAECVVGAARRFPRADTRTTSCRMRLWLGCQVDCFFTGLGGRSFLGVVNGRHVEASFDRKQLVQAGPDATPILLELVSFEIKSFLIL